MMDHWVSVGVVRIKVASYLATLNHSNQDLRFLKEGLIKAFGCAELVV